MMKDLLSLIGSFLSRLTGKLIVGALFAAGITLYTMYRDGRRQENPLYVKGVIMHRYDGKQGPLFQYKIVVDGRTYLNSAHRKLCSECKYISCVVGDSLLVEYRDGNPANNTPVCFK